MDYHNIDKLAEEFIDFSQCENFEPDGQEVTESLVMVRVCSHMTSPTLWRLDLLQETSLLENTVLESRFLDPESQPPTEATVVSDLVESIQSSAFH